MRALMTIHESGPKTGQFIRKLVQLRGSQGTGMCLTGMPDEATKGKDIHGQIEAHQVLGLRHMDLRMAVDSDGKPKNVVAIDDAAFGKVERAVNEADLVVSCFESSIANWTRNLTDPLGVDIDELQRAIPRMKALGTEWIRVMSWKTPADMQQNEAAPLVFSRMRNLVDIAEKGGVVLLQENCTGFGGRSAENALRLVEQMDSPNFGLIFDSGNCIPHLQDPVQFLLETMMYTRFVHIKDCYATVYQPDTEIYTLAGQGSAKIREILFQLMLRGYNGGLSMEPHVADKIHLGIVAKTEKAAYDSYVDYGRAFKSLLAEVTADYEGFIAQKK
ncbi:MAG: sugar phosphate isomerase/epimerase [Candidatus Margulisiibacteriota bacterium]